MKVAQIRQQLLAGGDKQPQAQAQAQAQAAADDGAAGKLAKTLTFDSALPDNSGPEKEPLKVVLRIRPLDSARKASVVTELEDGKSVRIVAPKSSAAFKTGGETEEVYHFTGVFGPDTTQDAVYASIAQPILSSVLSFECDGLIFSFGVTNSGKSYTIYGTQEQPGITPRVLRTVFNSLKPGDAAPTDTRIPVDLNNYRYGVQLSCLEIYNELIFDLLADLDTQKEPLKITLNSTGHYRVSGNRDVTVRSFEEALQVLEQAKQARNVAETKLNTDSSRSHSIFTVKLVAIPKEHVVPKAMLDANPHKYVKCKRLCVIDLAGSERAKRTNNSGARLEEASNINLSLMTFKLCIDALRHNQLHPTRPPKPVPYRDSKLTMMFRDYFQDGAGRAAMVVNVNPQVADYDETARVMKFSAMAQDVKLAVSRIDTGRVPGNKTKSRTAPPAPEVEPKVQAAPAVAAAAPAVASAVPADAAKLQAELAAARAEAAEQIEALKVQLVQAKLEAAEARGELVQLDASIREEVASEMAQDMFRNQLECEQRVVEMRETLEEKYERKIEILDELNKSTQQRHAAKYQELVDEWNKLADEKDALQRRLDSLLAAKESGSDRKYNDVIKQLESQNSALEAERKRLTERLAEQDAGKQEWKAKVGHIAEAKIAQLQQENVELREELKQLKSGASLDDGRNAKRTARGKWGLKKKQRSGDLKEMEDDGSLAADPAAEGAEDGDWAHVPLEPSKNRNSDSSKANGNGNGAATAAAATKGGSWRKRRTQQQQQPTSPAAASASSEPVEVLELLKRAATPNNGKKHKAKQPSRTAIEVPVAPKPALSPAFADFAAAGSSGLERQDSNSMRLTELLVDVGGGGGDQNQAPRPASPALHKRSVSHASSNGSLVLGKADSNAPSAQAFVPVLLPAKAANNGRAARKAPTKNLF